MRGNEVSLEGRVGNVYPPKGKGPWKFSLATGGGKKRDGGNWPTDWHTIVAWGELGQVAAELKKGDKVQVLGSLRYDEWEKDGVKRREARVVAETLTAESKKADVPAKPLDATEITDDDIPF
jgi:single-stranded DNA-binding protein